MPDLRLGVCGLGLIGSSLVRAIGPQRCVVLDPSSAASAAMGELGATVVDSVSVSAMAECDVIALAAPTAVNSSLLHQLMATGPRVPTFDLGSVKEPILSVWHGDESFPFVGTHPMAGSERSGVAAGSTDLFRGSAWAVVVEPATDPDALALVVDVVLATGAHVVPVSAASHDETVAVVSHLAHLVSGALGSAAAAAPHPELALRLAAGSFRDGTRVAGSPPGRTAEFLVANPKHVAEVTRQTADALRAVADAVAAQDEAGVAAFLTPAHEVRTAYTAGRGSADRALTVPDAASLAQLLLTLVDTGSSLVARTATEVSVISPDEEPG